jgi:hypothetical protein
MIALISFFAKLFMFIADMRSLFAAHRWAKYLMNRSGFPRAIHKSNAPQQSKYYRNNNPAQKSQLIAGFLYILMQ